MQAFSDADHALDSADQKFISKYIFIIFNDTVYFSITKQRFAASFTTEDESIVLNLFFQKTIQTWHLISNIEGIPRNLVVLLLFGNNNALLQLSKKVSNTSKIENIDTNFQQIIEKVQNRLIKLFQISSKQIFADGFTKSFF